jgi:C4-dicarboxylate transporter DctQ subunit
VPHAGRHGVSKDEAPFQLMIDRGLTALRAVERGVLAALMLSITALYAFNVVVRSLTPWLAGDVAWIDEAALYGLAWLVFLGLGLTLERGRHIAVTMLFDALGTRPRRAVGAAIDLIGLVFSLYIAKLGVDITVFVGNSGQLSPTLDVSAAWLYAAVPVGFLLLALRYLLSLAGFIDRRTTGGAP